MQKYEENNGSLDIDYSSLISNSKVKNFLFFSQFCDSCFDYEKCLDMTKGLEPNGIIMAITFMYIW